MERIGIDSLKETMDVEILRNQQYWESATLHRAVWMRKQRWELSLLEQRRGTCSHWKVGQLPGHTTLKRKGKCPGPPVPPSNLLPAPPIGRAQWEGTRRCSPRASASQDRAVTQGWRMGERTTSKPAVPHFRYLLANSLHNWDKMYTKRYAWRCSL